MSVTKRAGFLLANKAQLVARECRNTRITSNKLDIPKAAARKATIYYATQLASYAEHLLGLRSHFSN